MRKQKLHELLAVEGDLKGEFVKIAEESVVTFTKKADHFQGSIRTLKMVSADRENEEAAGEVRKELVTTVGEKLNWTWQAAMKYFDGLLAKEKTNQVAMADLIVEGEVLAKDLPATFLLGMEDRLKTVRAVYDQAPTMPPGISWAADPGKGDGVYKAEHPEKVTKTEKDFNFKVLYAATDKHPAQIEKWDDSKVVGVYTTQKWNGMLTPAQKAAYLERVDNLIKSVKQARQRANAVEVVEGEIGTRFWEYIHKLDL